MLIFDETLDGAILSVWHIGDRQYEGHLIKRAAQNAQKEISTSIN